MKALDKSKIICYAKYILKILVCIYFGIEIIHISIKSFNFNYLEIQKVRIELILII